MGPCDLSTALSGIEWNRSDDRVIIDCSDNDDAGAIVIGRETILQTVDMITPIVSDPFTFGEIAAANSLSDIYAMGGAPVSALNIACFPSDCLDTSILCEILKGSAKKAAEAGVAVIGGHTVIDSEIKFGLAVSGLPGRKILRNSEASSGLDIILTKPLGVGLISTALRAGMAECAHIMSMTDSMRRLNKYAAETMATFDVATATDVTGFGLLGHLYEVCRASGITAKLWRKFIPELEGAQACFNSGMIPAGAYRNRDFLSSHITGSDDSSLFLSSPETSGGLLIFCNASDTQALLRALKSSGDGASVKIGVTKPAPNGTRIEILD